MTRPPPYPPPGSGYGPWPPAEQPWPYGDGRPGVATAAGVLGIVTGGLTAMACVVWLIATMLGDGASAVMLLAGVPCAAGTISGGIRLLGGHRRGLLLGSSLFSIAVLLLTLGIGGFADDSSGYFGVAFFVLVALPLPVVTAVLAAHKTVTGWSEGWPPH